MFSLSQKVTHSSLEGFKERMDRSVEDLVLVGSLHWQGIRHDDFVGPFQLDDFLKTEKFCVSQALKCLIGNLVVFLKSKQC